MKRIILAFLFLIVLATPALGTDYAYLMGGRPAPGGAAVSVHCTNTADSDVFCEDFDNPSANYCVGSSGDANCRNTWTTDTEGGSIDFTTAHSGTLSCGDNGSNALQLTKTTTYGVLYVRLSKVDADYAYVQFYMNLVSHNLANGAITNIFTMSDTSGNNTMHIRLNGTADANAPYIQVLYHDGSKTQGGSEKTITPGTWYRIRVQWKKSSGSNDGFVKFYVDSTAVTEVTTNNSTRQTGRFSWGLSTGPDSDEFVLQVDNIKVDDDTEPGACS